MVTEFLNPEECDLLLKLARQALEFSVRGEPRPKLALEAIPEKLLAQGATFVTLTKSGRLRGCIGTLEPYRSLAEDAQQHAIAAAFNDYRFPDVTPAELDDIQIEISCLTAPARLQFNTPDELIAKLRPGVDGVVFRDGSRRATFLPQVWEKLPDTKDFLNQLAMKMGAPSDTWRSGELIVETYQVQEFHE